MIHISATKCAFFGISICGSVSIVFAIQAGGAQFPIKRSMPGQKTEAPVSLEQGITPQTTLQEELQRQKKQLLPVRPRTAVSVSQIPLTPEVAGTTPEKKSLEPEKPKSKVLYYEFGKSNALPTTDEFNQIPKMPYQLIKPSPTNTISVAAILRYVQQVIRDYFNAYRPKWLSSLFPRWFEPQPIPIR
jgi:hypothetical protein